MNFANTLVFAAFVVAGSAAAQSAAPAAGAPSATAPVSCPKPDNHPGRLASDQARKGWIKEVQSWTTCMKKYVGEIQAQADEAVKSANAAVARSNAAVNDYNTIVKDLQTQADAATSK